MATVETRSWSIEFPSEMNGHMTERSGFYASKGFGPSGFFIDYADAGEAPRLAFDGPVSKSVQALAERAVRKHHREHPVHVGHWPAFGGGWFCDTCNSPLCELA